MNAAITLRQPTPYELPADLAWVTQQHGRIYALEYGWNAEFETLVAGICADYAKNYSPEWERCWIVEKGGVRVGSVFVVKVDEQTAKLRMLILTPEARGTGLGGRLSDEAIEFARSKGYKKMVLWTNSYLTAARSIYEKRGFKLVGIQPYQGFGKNDLASETWQLQL